MEEGTQICVCDQSSTPNAECGVSYCPPDAEATDTALNLNSSPPVDELSAPYLEDAEIDFVTDQLGSQLTLKAPEREMREVFTMLADGKALSICCNPRLTRSWLATAVASMERCVILPFCSLAVQRLFNGRCHPERRIEKQRTSSRN